MTLLSERLLPSVLTPRRYRVVGRRVETPDTVTLTLAPVAEHIGRFAAGQFTMVYAFGIGEIPLSISGDPTTADGRLEHTLRAVGAVSRALHDADLHDVVGLRGPFGVAWDVTPARGGDLVVAAGGIGLAPLRPVVLAAIADRAHYRRVVVLIGARTPADLVFRDEYDRWRAHDVEVHVTVDRATPGWRGSVGVVTGLIERGGFDPRATTAYLCGPEAMMHFTALALVERGVPASCVQLSLERAMSCGVGQCGRCQLGPVLVCRDGPVLSYAVAAGLMKAREL